MILFKKILILLCLVGLVSVYAMEPVKTSASLSKGQGKIDDPLMNRARAYLDKGKLKIAVENYGIFSGTASPQGQWGDFQYISNLSLVVGIPGTDIDGKPAEWAMGPKPVYDIKEQRIDSVGTDTTYWGATVSESWFDRTPNLNRTDWEAVDYSRTQLHNPLATAGEYYGSLGLYTNMEDQYPLIATSDIPETWPGIEGERFWPGPWAVDPADSSGTNQMKGVFVSDQDIYFEFDDRLATRDVDPKQGYPIGIKAKVSGYSYGASISEDIIFFKMVLHNESPYTYHGMYAGFYFDVDSYNRLANGSYAGRTNDDDMMSYNTDWDFGYIYDLDGDHGNPYVGDKDLAYSAVKLLDTPIASEPIDLDADGIPDVYPGDKLGLTSWHWFDWYFRPGARDESPNGGPWSGDGQTPVAPNKEEIQYKILAGDTTNLTPYDSTYYFHPLRSSVGYGALNPRFDSVEGLLYEYDKGLDCVFIMGSGPFTMAPGDSVPFSFCVLMGEDEADLVSNAKIAQLMYDNNYQGARPPKAPNVLVKEDDRKVTLYWDDVSVNDQDIITGIKDFEGFRIYRSEDNGKTWGTKMFDEETATTYWKPLAQFDLKDDITGFEPLKPHRYLGDDSGIQFSYTDLDVENGREYLYAVCAYDFGFIPNDPVFDPDSVGAQKALNFEVPSLENYLSNSTNLSHIVKAIPHRLPSNFEKTEIIPERTEGTIGRSPFNIELVDNSKITGDDYEIIFDCDYSDPPQNFKQVKGSHTYSLVRLHGTQTDTLLKNSRRYVSNYTDDDLLPPMIDGLRWGIEIVDKISTKAEEAYWTENSQCTYDMKTVRIQSGGTRADYELRYKGGDADTVFDKQLQNVKFMVPFELWNTITNRKAKLSSWSPNDSLFDKGVTLFAYENHWYENPDEDRYIKKTLQFSLTWRDSVTYDEDGNKIEPDTAWAPGDVMIIPVNKPYDRGDKFIVHTANIFAREDVTEKNIKEVKVVPNPYIVHAGWENDYFVRKIQFTNLPAECKITVFTVSGEKVITLHHNNSFDGSEDWDLLTLNRQEAAPGLYVYVVEADNGVKYTGKFVVIK